MVFYFYDEYAEEGNLSVNTVKRDYSKATVGGDLAINLADAVETNESRPENRRIYVDGMGGVISELTFSETFFKELEAVREKENELAQREDPSLRYTNMGVSQAKMSIYFTDSDYDWQNIPNLSSLIDEMDRRGITFTPASGRQLPNLKELFAPRLGKIAIIAENGGLCWFEGRIIYCDPTPADDILYALDIIKREEGLYPLCSGVDCAYYDSDDEQFIEVLNRSYSSAKRVDDLEKAVKNNTILKISVWDKLPAAEHAAVVPVVGVDHADDQPQQIGGQVVHPQRVQRKLIDCQRNQRVGYAHDAEFHELPAFGDPWPLHRVAPKGAKTFHDGLPLPAEAGMLVPLYRNAPLLTIPTEPL